MRSTWKKRAKEYFMKQDISWTHIDTWFIFSYACARFETVLLCSSTSLPLYLSVPVLFFGPRRLLERYFHRERPMEPSNEILVPGLHGATKYWEKLHVRAATRHNFSPPRKQRGPRGLVLSELSTDENRERSTGKTNERETRQQRACLIPPFSLLLWPLARRSNRVTRYEHGEQAKILNEQREGEVYVRTRF